MQAQDITSYARTLASEANVNQRWQDSQLISFADRAQKMLVRTLRWPESVYAFTSTPLVQEYQLPEMIRVLRVYVNGQIVQRTDIPTLEGQQTGINDQSGTGGGPAGLVGAGLPPVLAGGQNSPAWTSQPAAAYPLGYGDFASPAAPWYIGKRPSYYLRGGNIGFVPTPIGAYPVRIDNISQPFTLVNPTDTCVLPDILLDALAWKVVELMSFADSESDAGASSARDYANKQYLGALGEARAWKKTYDGVGSRGPNLLALRTFYRGTAQHAYFNGRGDEH